MIKQKINVFDYAGIICKAMSKGILLTTKVNEKVNTMTIGWGTLGIEWNKPIFVAYVRESRFTRELLEQNAEFTVNLSLDAGNNQFLKYCGTASGRNTDKINDLSLSLVESDIISVPGFKEFPLTLECRVIAQYLQDPKDLPETVQNRFYPKDMEQGKQDAHIAYYGEIVNAYLIEE